MNKDEVLQVVGEPVAFIHRTKQHDHLSYFSNLSEVPASETYLNTERLYTEAQLLAMYAKGAEDGWAACESSHGIDPATGVRGQQKPVGYVRAYALDTLRKPGHTVIDAEPRSEDDIALCVCGSAIPITPKNTEGEQA